MDALSQVVHLVEVLAPAVVDDLQQDRPLELAHDLVAEVLFAPVVGGERIGEQALAQVLAVGLLGLQPATSMVEGQSCWTWVWSSARSQSSITSPGV